MKPEISEVLFIKEIYSKSLNDGKSEMGELDRVDSLTGDASTRRYYRLYCKNGTLVVCLDNPILENEEYNFLKMQKFLENNKIRVPKIFDYKNSKGYLLEEDLGDITLLSYLSKINDKDEEYNSYKICIDELLKMHKIPKEKLDNINLFFDFKKLMDEIEFTVEYYLKKFLKVDDQSICSAIKQEFVDICKRISNEKMVYTHRDYHSRNVMVRNNEFIIIDFQDARQGIPQYDLVSLLEDCYYSIDTENKEKLIKYYWDSLDKSIHGQQNFEYFMCLYNDMTMQRVFKAIGSFSYIFDTREDHRYIKYIGYAMEKLKTVMLSDQRYKSLRKKLMNLYYES